MVFWQKFWKKQDRQRIVVIIERSEKSLFNEIHQEVVWHERNGWRLKGSKNIFNNLGVSFSSAEIGNEGVVVEYERIDAFFQSILIFTR